MHIKPFVAEATLDLHDKGRLTNADIEIILGNFLTEQHADDRDTVLVITGKGLHSPSGPILKPLVAKYLSKHPLVEDFKVGSVENGGQGAYEVWIRD
ncbi:MAG: Smr/MutS family protein [Candidatus Dojkabacteria bacterium]